MNIGLISSMALALGLAACAHPDAPPANEPPVVDTTSARSEVTSFPAAAPRAAADSRTTTVGAAPVIGRSEPTSGAALPPAPGEAAVASNPGVADETKDATNTKVNERDRHGALTPMEQGGSQAERNITASIRRGVVSDKALSFTAKNVKIITTGSKVTLRGPVKNDQERSAIETRAKQTPGVTEVENQLELKK
jgi:hypothetical protein